MLYLELFNREYIEKAPIKGVIVPSDLNYLKRLYIYNRDSISKYYKSRNFAVKNTHILSRILEHFPYYSGLSDYRYINYSFNKIKYLSKHFKFTSDIEKGIVHKDYFFGNNNEEIIIADFEDFNVSNVISNWENVSAISILKCDRNDDRLLLPLGIDDGSKANTSFILINIPKLALQYRQFLKKQSLNSDNNSIVLNKNHFVIKYVLSNTLEDIIDHMFLNRIMTRFYNQDIITPKYKHKFKIFTPETQLNRYVNNTLDVITNKKLDFVNLLTNINLVFKINALELLMLPSISYTRNIKNFLFLSRLDYILFLYDVSTMAKSLSQNRHFLNDFKRLAERILKDKVYTGLYSYEEEKNINEKLYRITQF